MAFKFVIISCLVAVVRAGALPAAVVAEPVLARLEDFNSAPEYTFAYDIIDTLTGDVKGQYEKRDGPAVTGSYYLNQPDGLRRIVDYFADENGFNARVRNEPLTAPVVAAEPVVAEAEVVPTARVVAAPAPAPVAPAPVFAPAFTSAYTEVATPFARIANYPFPRFTAPFARAPIVAV